MQKKKNKKTSYLRARSQTAVEKRKKKCTLIECRPPQLMPVCQTSHIFFCPSRIVEFQQKVVREKSQNFSNVLLGAASIAVPSKKSVQFQVYFIVIVAAAVFCNYFLLVDAESQRLLPLIVKI
jgi:hypothetical protein